MNKEQQIEETERWLCHNCSHYGSCNNSCEKHKDFAMALYIAGYRKVPDDELFTENMKNVLEIEKKQAVKEFAEKIKNEVYPFLQAKMYDKKHFICGTTVVDKELENQNIGILKAQDVLSQWFNIKIDELLKEYEND